MIPGIHHAADVAIGVIGMATWRRSLRDRALVTSRKAASSKGKRRDKQDHHHMDRSPKSTYLHSHQRCAGRLLPLLLPPCTTFINNT